jgi:hypothetical protein
MKSAVAQTGSYLRILRCSVLLCRIVLPDSKFQPYCHQLFDLQSTIVPSERKGLNFNFTRHFVLH